MATWKTGSPSRIQNRYDNRDKTEAVLLRLDWLEEPERTLMAAHFVHHVSIRSLAEMLNKSEKTISVRLRGLAGRLAHGEFVHLMRHRDWFSEVDIQVAYDHFILKIGYRRISDKRSLSFYEVRQRLHRIQRCVGSVGKASGQPRRCVGE